jgi:hypothetical protein
VLFERYAAPGIEVEILFVLALYKVSEAQGQKDWNGKPGVYEVKSITEDKRLFYFIAGAQIKSLNGD